MLVAKYEPVIETFVTDSAYPVDLQAGLTHLLQLGNDPHQAMRIAVFSKISVAADGSVLDAKNSCFWVKIQYKSTQLDHNNGVVRVSMTHYNTLDEVDALVAALDEILNNLV